MSSRNDPVVLLEDDDDDDDDDNIDNSNNNKDNKDNNSMAMNPWNFNNNSNKNNDNKNKNDHKTNGEEIRSIRNHAGALIAEPPTFDATENTVTSNDNATATTTTSTTTTCTTATANGSADILAAVGCSEPSSFSFSSHSFSLGRLRRRARRQAGATGSGSGSGSGAAKKSRAAAACVAVGEPELEELMRRSEYEVTQDPYRGIGFLDGKSENNTAIRAAATKMPTATAATATTTGKYDFSAGGTSQINDNDNDNGDCDCENDARDHESAKPMHADENESDDDGGNENEVENDSGNRSDPAFKRIVTPWDACQWGILSPLALSRAASGGGGESPVLDPGDPENLVKTLTESCCPSLLAWTRQRQQQQQQRPTAAGTKRNRSGGRAAANSNSNSIHAASNPTANANLGTRPSDANYRCPCDSNPFCLASLGGVVNELLRERCQRGITVTIPDDENENNDDDENDNDENDNDTEKGGEDGEKETAEQKNGKRGSTSDFSSSSSSSTNGNRKRARILSDAAEETPIRQQQQQQQQQSSESEAPLQPLPSRVEIEILDEDDNDCDNERGNHNNNDKNNDNDNNNNERDNIDNIIDDIIEDKSEFPSHGGGVLALVARGKNKVMASIHTTIRAAKRAATAGTAVRGRAPAANDPGPPPAAGGAPPAVLTCEPLGPRWIPPATGDPADVFAEDPERSAAASDGGGTAASIGNPRLRESDYYSPATKETIERLRKSEDADLSRLRKHAERVLKLAVSSSSSSSERAPDLDLEDDGTPRDPDRYLRILEDWHESLLFCNPTAAERPGLLGRSNNNSNSNNKKTATIAVPPGIQNLGATCYLNTQLQCLAQNPVFRDGIFSWRPVHPTHTMNGVMTRLQKLLGELLVGGESTYTSLDFSNALGIQHNEQQDPNEFARLLFDRMEESFQQCSSNGNGNGNGDQRMGSGDAATAATRKHRSSNDLGGLLQRIFHGTTTYETICTRCGNSSVRNEGFMDLNLPIVHRPPHERSDDDSGAGKDESAADNTHRSKRRKKGSIQAAFDEQRKTKKRDNAAAASSSSSTDVQYCFDQYTEDELLDEDNQYYCETCESKEDALRVTTLTELPPVLNIQLSRYVFDREKFVKKKLTDPVRLPLDLSVKKSKGRKRYVLCAVMRHQGTSAYSGHYVAEAMDWTTGQWYEFNDETVTVLPAPSCSFVPPDASSRDGKPKNENDDDDDDEDEKDDGDDEVICSSGNQGSQDAYNMYYVDEDYLGKEAVATMARNHRLNSTSRTDLKGGKSNGGVGNDDDDNAYDNDDDDVLSELIREKLHRYSVLTELCTEDYAISDRLRRRKAGIRKYMFGDPSALLMTRPGGGGNGCNDENEPLIWVDGQRLRQFLACDRSLDVALASAEPLLCSESMLCLHGRLHPRRAREGKLLRKSVYNSYAALLQAERKLVLAAKEGEPSGVVGCVMTANERVICPQCSKSYRKELSRKLDFVRNVHELYKDILGETTDSTKNNNAVLDPSADPVESEYTYIVSRSAISKFKKLVVDTMKSIAGFENGGCLDSNAKSGLLLNGIDDLDLSSFPGSPDPALCTASPDSIDKRFNSKITCSHGNCKDFNQRIVRYVPYATWSKIKKVFPSAIEHKILMYSVDGKMRKPNVDDDGCAECREEKDAIHNLTFDVENWAKETKENFALKPLLDGKKISEGEIAVHNFDCAQSNCRLVHRDDIANLCKAVKSLSRLSRTKITEQMKLKTYVENLAFPSYHSVVLDFEKQPSARLLQSLRSLTCCEHKRVIKSAIIDVFRKDEELEHKYRLSNGITVLSAQEYNAYINSLAQLLIILNRNYPLQVDADGNLEENATALLDDVKNFAGSYHPTITSMASKQDAASDEILLFSLDGNSKEFSIVPGICENETCKKDFVPLVQKAKREVVESVSDNSVDSMGHCKKAASGTLAVMGSVAMSPIIVESDLEDFTDTADNTLSFRVFQYKGDSELSDATQSLRTAVGLPSTDDDPGFNSGLRRSTRRRKVKFPVGCITRQQKIDIGLHHNVAALRLMLYQNCQVPLGCRLSVALCLDDASPPRAVDVAFDWTERTLSTIVDELKPLEDSEPDVVRSNPTNHIFLLYHVNKDDGSGEIETTLMDSLLQVSNLQSSESANHAKKEGKNRKNSSERGFQGTLLQSSASSGLASQEQNTSNHDPSGCETEAKPNQEQSRPRSNTIISDSEADSQAKEEEDSQAKTEEEKSLAYSSDGEVTILPSPSPRRADVRERARNTIDDEKKMILVGRLKELTNSTDESICFEAVSWAIKSNPKYGEMEIFDSAYAKFFDLCNK